MINYSELEKASFTHTVVMYDGLCPFCHFLVRFIAGRDKKDLFRFVSQQCVSTEGLMLGNTDSVMVLSRGILDIKAKAVIITLKILGGIYFIPAMLLSAAPQSIVDRAYDFIATNRKKWFGTYESCPMPPAGISGKFLGKPFSGTD